MGIMSMCWCEDVCLSLPWQGAVRTSAPCPRRSASDAQGSHVGCHGVSARDRGSLADPVSHKSAWQRGASPTSLSEQKPETRNL